MLVYNIKILCEIKSLTVLVRCHRPTPFCSLQSIHFHFGARWTCSCWDIELEMIAWPYLYGDSLLDCEKANIKQYRCGADIVLHLVLCFLPAVQFHSTARWMSGPHSADFRCLMVLTCASSHPPVGVSTAPWLRCTDATRDLVTARAVNMQSQPGDCI